MLSDRPIGSPSEHSDGLGWTCQDFKTGQLVWSEKAKLGKGAISYADGHFYLLEEGGGNVVLIDHILCAFAPLRFKIPEPLFARVGQNTNNPYTFFPSENQYYCSEYRVDRPQFVVLNPEMPPGRPLYNALQQMR